MYILKLCESSTINNKPTVITTYATPHIHHTYRGIRLLTRQPEVMRDEQYAHPGGGNTTQ